MRKGPDVDETKPAPAAPVYRYIGSGDYVVGIPARDLTAADLAALDESAIEASGLYEKDGGARA